MYYFYQYLFLLVVLTCWKRNTLKFQKNFTLKRGKLFLKHYFLLHWMCYIAHQYFIWTTRNLSFRIYFCIAPKRSQKITINFSTFVTGVKHISWCLLRPWYIGLPLILNKKFSLNNCFPCFSTPRDSEIELIRIANFYHASFQASKKIR